MVTPDAGTIKINGQPSTIQSPADAAQLGIVPVFQELSLLPDLTVAENIFIANPPRNRFGLINREALETANRCSCSPSWASSILTPTR